MDGAIAELVVHWVLAGAGSILQFASVTSVYSWAGDITADVNVQNLP